MHTISRRDVVRRLLVPAAPVAISADLHLLARATFGPNPPALAELHRLGAADWLEQQLEPDGIDDSAFENALLDIVQPYTNTAADIRMLAGAIYSRRQLQWRMTHFLNNHFSTYRGATVGISESQEDDEFRKNCFSTFATVLRLSATSPAMIDFLDSQSNVAGNPNENYARELMELSTLGVNGGYTELDVAEVARVFTGWARTNVSNGTVITASRFRFRPTLHDTGPKTTSLGWSTPGISGVNGFLEGFSLLDFLAAHPSTATRFTEKLCQYFVGDQPPAGLLARVRQQFVATGGDLRATVRAVFLDPEFGTAGNVRAKVHDGFEFVANVMRRFEVTAPSFAALNTQVGLLKSQPHQFPVPTGYPEIGAAWQGSGALLPRWKFVDDFLQNRISTTRVQWTTLYGSNTPVGSAAWVAALLDRLVDGDVPATTVQALILYMNGRYAQLPSNPTLNQLTPHLRDLASVILRLPEVQLQ
jgi:uncharacterized protein (DUF1800 family)